MQCADRPEETQTEFTGTEITDRHIHPGSNRGPVALSLAAMERFVVRRVIPKLSDVGAPQPGAVPAAAAHQRGEPGKRKSVFAYWCTERCTRQRTENLVLELVTAIDEEDGRNHTEVVLDEAEGEPRRRKQTRRNLQHLNKYIDEIFMRPYRDRIQKALAPEKIFYVPGDDIEGNKLHEFSEQPRLTAPLHCMLCGDGFLSDARLERHIDDSHVSVAEYRKRLLFLYEENGPQAVTASEKRNMVQNFAHFQQYSHPGVGSCVFSESPPVARSEAACAICARLNWKEHRVKINLFADPPIESQSNESEDEDGASDADEHTSAATTKPRIVWSDGVAYLQNPPRVHELLSVDRYHERWPLIPPEELHASSIQHPNDASWRWLLHSRRVPVLTNSDAPQPAAGEADRPPCAGIGDAAMPVWCCRECMEDLCGKHPKMPLNAVANDNWIGREKLIVRNATRATHWLSCLGRFCWKQLRLGRGPPSSGTTQPAADVRQSGVTGNTIFFAQPTAEVPRMVLPPDEGDIL